MVNHEGCPSHSLKKALEWYKAKQQKRVATNKKSANLQTEPHVPRKGLKEKTPSNTGDSLLDGLNNSIAVADSAFEEYEYSRVWSPRTLSARLSEHSKAMDARLKAEKAYREEMERREVLVNKQAITEKCARCLQAVLRRLKKLPTESGPQCNPGNPLMATKILQKIVDEIQEAGQRALQELS